MWFWGLNSKISEVSARFLAKGNWRWKRRRLKTISLGPISSFGFLHGLGRNKLRNVSGATEFSLASTPYHIKIHMVTVLIDFFWWGIQSSRLLIPTRKRKNLHWALQVTFRLGRILWTTAWAGTGPREIFLPVRRVVQGVRA